MSGQQIPLNSVPNDPTLSDLLNLLKKEIFLDLNCCHVGTVKSFDVSKQTAEVTINYTKTFFQLNPETKTYQPVQQTYPVLTTCPAIILGGGQSYLNMPIASGDECLLFFNDRDIDNWWSAGTTTQPNATGRAHSFSDAFALVGLKSAPNAISGFDAERVLITNGNIKVGINPSNNKATIQNQSVGTLNSLLQNILTQIENLCTACAAITVSGVTSGPGVSGPPVNASTISGIGSQLSTYANQLGNLLE